MKRILSVLLVGFLALAWAQPCQNAAALSPSTVQGLERRSPYLGQEVEVQGVVTATYPGRDSLGGFFVQDPRGDMNPRSSDALFVRYPRRGELSGLRPTPGDLVSLTGKVLERNEMTQLDRLSELKVCRRAGPVEPTPLRFPVSDTGLEALEGMLVEVSETMSVTEVYNLGRYGEVLLSVGGRLFQPSNGQPSRDNDRFKLLLNDASSTENPDDLMYLGRDRTLRLGDTVTGLRGIVFNHGMGAYRIEPVGPVRFERSNPRPTRPPEVGGRLKVAGLNALNYFTSLNERGADNTEEFDRQQDKLLSTLARLDADAIGLMEIENNGNEAVQHLVDGLNRRLRSRRYAAVPLPPRGVGIDQIRQAIIYKPAVLELMRVDSDTSVVHDRPPLIATFRERSSGEIFSLVVVHFKSKGSCPPSGDTDKGQGCWNLLRSDQAAAVANFAAELERRSGDPDVLVVGDINSYRMERPLAVLADAGFGNLDERLPLAERYSYVFRGESGTLDYALASRELESQVSGFGIWHINSDEPPILDYNLEFNPPQLYRPDVFRSSDHDPVVVGLDLR